MILEGYCDTEDRSTDAENSACYYRFKLHFKIYWKRKQLFNLLLSLLLLTYFDQINAALVRIRDF